MKQPYGALREDWEYFDFYLGLGADLLPVVSHPDAVISPQSAMKQLGKTPSQYNGREQVAGLPNWTSMRATSRDLERWMAQPDYGFCVQTREAKLFDLDIADKKLVEEIVAAIGAFLGVTLPKRWRNNSGKCGLMFRLDGEYRKRILRVEGGMIEFLANGQQFIACGTHPSGARYQWTPEQPELITITAEQFEALWSYLEAEYGTAPAIEVGGARRRGPTVSTSDRTLDYLWEKGLVNGGSDDRVDIDCPFADEHTTESTESSTSYFPAGTQGYEVGHFRCLHAHCAGRNDGDFLKALGVYMDEIEELPSLPVPVERKRLKVTRNKAGQILNDFGNIVQFLVRDDITKWSLARDTFRDEIMIRPFDEEGNGNWRPLTDVDYGTLRVELTERLGFKQIGKDLMRDAVLLVADQHKFDSAINWGNSLVWDGVPRIEQFFQRFYQADDTAYTRAVGLYMWSAMAGRLMEPGVKADMVPVLVGPQGIGKSLGVAELVQNHELRDTINLMDRDADLARIMRGRLILEIGELRGLHGRDMEAIKDFISRSDDSWVPKYLEFATKYKRRCIMIGTTNQQEFLADRTGNRRWLPVRVGRGDVQAIREQRAQLWAEGIVRFKEGGVQWREAEKLGHAEHHHYRMADSYEELIHDWLETVDEEDGSTPASRGQFTLKEVLNDALHVDARAGKGVEMKVGSILREIGWTRKKLRVEGKTKWLWVLDG